MTDTLSSPGLAFDNILAAPQSRQHASESRVTSNRQPTSVAKRLNRRKKIKGIGSSGLVSSQVTSSYNSPTFASIRSQFFAMSFQDRLQFVSWLFEGALSQCISPPTGSGIESLTNHGQCLHPNTISRFEDRSSVANGADIFEWCPHHGSYFEPQNHDERLRAAGGRNWPEDDQHEYEIEKILTHRQDTRGSISYLVKWKGYDDIEATWEPGVSLQDTVALEDYESQLNDPTDEPPEKPSRNRSARRTRQKFYPY
jgi:isopenicillin N synthase-like dioxygenase